MLSTLAQVSGLRCRRPRLGPRRPSVLVAAGLVSLLGPGCVGLGRGASPVVGNEVAALRPSEAGTYRLVGTVRDSRTSGTRRLVESYSVEPYFTRAGVDHQITRYSDSEGSSRTWETAFRPNGAYRLHESAGDASWDWEPPLLSTVVPLRVGRTWRAHSTATVPDVAGTRRVTSVGARSKVVDTATLSVGGERVFALVIDATVSTTMTDTNRADRKSTTYVTTTRARTWFSPDHMLVVKSSGSTEVEVKADGASDASEGGTSRYVLVRRVQLESL